ncbi:MAG TPA: TonB family protein [Steroidobacteraceae bacterium]|nr:TonB family protein [Steroidobacteraceae bacterium]
MAHSALHPLAEAGFVSPALSERAVVFAGIVAFHVVLAYLFASGLAIRTGKLVFEPFVATVINKPQKTVPPPPLPPIDFHPPTIDPGPVPEIQVNMPTDARIAITAPPMPPTSVVEQAPPRPEPIHLVGKHQLPNTEDYYPPSLRRLGVEGATTINVCVDERGKRTGEPTVMESSGNPRLDEGAIAIARAGKYARSARGATFVPNCYGFRIVFRMQNP